MPNGRKKVRVSGPVPVENTMSIELSTLRVIGALLIFENTRFGWTQRAVTQLLALDTASCRHCKFPTILTTF